MLRRDGFIGTEDETRDLKFVLTAPKSEPKPKSEMYHGMLGTNEKYENLC